MTTQLNDIAKQNLKNSLEENIRLYPESWEHEECLEDYVRNLWDAELDYAEERGEDFPSFPDYLLLHIELLYKLNIEGETPENLAWEIVNNLRRFESGQFEDSFEDRIVYEAADGELHDIIYAGNPNWENFKDTPDEPTMVWCVEGYTNDGLHYEGDDFEYLFDVIDDLEITIQG